MADERKSIWIDLDNSPHVPLFVPIINRFRESGIEVIVTARDHAQTVELLKLAEVLDYTVIGKHNGRSRVRKAGGLAARTLQLVRFIRKRSRPKVAVSHGSRSMVLAARTLRIPILTMYDYEYTETKIFNIFSTRVLVPDGIDDATLDAIGLPRHKRAKYSGLKEELYMRSFRPDTEFWPRFLGDNELSISDDKVIVVLRPPATSANYHDERADRIMDSLIGLLARRDDVVTILIPRTADQKEGLSRLVSTTDPTRTRFAIPKTAVSGPDLLFNADVVISGGGTMNREAALLGVPVYSIFQGRQGALDRAMEASGEIRFIRNEDDIGAIQFQKRLSRELPELTSGVEDTVVEQIDSLLAHG